MQVRRALFSGLAVLWCLVPGVGRGLHWVSGSAEDGSFDSEIARATRKLLPLLEEYPGLSVAVGVDREIVWSEGFGYADLERRVPVTTSTRFSIYSVSKSLTGAAVAKLWESGKLDLDAALTRYLPEFRGEYREITARQLLGHIAGIPHVEHEEEEASWGSVAPFHCTNPKDAWSTFIDLPLVARPGDRSVYSTEGYILLSSVIEAVARPLSFTEYMKRSVVAPAGMRATSLDGIEAQRATAYLRNEAGEPQKARYVDSSCRMGGGGFVSTPEDMVRFGLALLGGQLITPKTLETVYLEPITTSNGESTGSGFGVAVGTSKETGYRYASHGGADYGGRAMFLAITKPVVVVAIAGNLMGPHLHEQAREIADMFAGARRFRDENSDEHRN